MKTHGAGAIWGIMGNYGELWGIWGIWGTFAILVRFTPKLDNE